MEDTLRDIEAKGFENDVFVLILVLMEDTLRVTLLEHVWNHVSGS